MVTLFFSSLKIYDFFLKKGSVSWEASALNVLTGTKVVKYLEMTPKNHLFAQMWFKNHISAFFTI